MALNDESPMPWGKHKGVKMEDVPDRYLLWLYEENKCSGDVREYIEENLDAIKSNIKNHKEYK